MGKRPSQGVIIGLMAAGAIASVLIALAAIPRLPYPTPAAIVEPIQQTLEKAGVPPPSAILPLPLRPRPPTFGQRIDARLPRTLSKLHPVASAEAFLTLPMDPRPFSPHNPHFVPLQNSVPIPIWAALLPPGAYFMALALLPPFEGINNFLIVIAGLLKFALAAISIASFAILPFRYHVPGSAVLTYQLGLVGCFGAGRAFDLFFLSHPRVPRRLAAIDDPNGQIANGQLYPATSNEEWKVKAHPKGLGARLWWALDLMISMRGVGWDFATPDIRHDTNPWQRPSKRQLHRAFFRVGPILFVSLGLLRLMMTYIDVQVHKHPHGEEMLELAGITELPLVLRPIFVACTGLSLYALFDFGYTLVSAMALPVFQGSASFLQTGSVLRPNSLVPNAHNVDFYPLLNPAGLTSIRSVRSFWSKAWHRLFHRAFLIYGIVPFQNMAIRVEYAAHYLRSRIRGLPLPPPPFTDVTHGKPAPSVHADPGRAMQKGRGDWGKVLGAFIASGIIHAISERAALGGRKAYPHMHLFSQKGWQDTQLHLIRHKSSGVWSLARLLPPFSGSGELSFFVLNGIAVIVETAVGRAVLSYRRRQMKRPEPVTESIPTRSRTSSTAGMNTSNKVSALMLGKGSLQVRPSLGTVAGRRTTFGEQRSDSESEEGVKLSGERKSAPDLDAEVSSAAKALRGDEDLSRWYDAYIQITWTLAVLLTTGELFTEGWIASGVINEITMMKG